jgi:hypothetical protein
MGNVGRATPALTPEIEGITDQPMPSASWYHSVVMRSPVW